MNAVNFTDPVSYRYCTEASFSESLLECVDGYLNLNGRTAVVLPGVILDGSQETIIVQEIPSFILTALKISSYIVTLGILPVIMLLIKACLRSIHKFHITAMSEAGSRQRLQNLEAERVGAHAFVGQCARLNAVMPGCGTDIDRLLNSIPSSERDHFVTQGLRFTEVAGYHDVFVKMQCLEVLATIPCSERDHFVTQGLRLTEMLRGYYIARPLRVLSAVTDAQRKEFVTQALRVFEIINRNSDRVLVLEVLAEIPQVDFLPLLK